MKNTRATASPKCEWYLTNSRNDLVAVYRDTSEGNHLMQWLTPNSDRLEK